MKNTLIYEKAQDSLTFECLDSVNDGSNRIILSIDSTLSAVVEVYANSELHSSYNLTTDETNEIEILNDIFSANTVVEVRIADNSVFFTFPDFIGENLRLERTSDYDFSIKYVIQGDSVFLKAHPVNSLFISFDSNNPEKLYGGIWKSTGVGRVLIGVDPSDKDFSEAYKTGGEKVHTLSESELPSHTHEFRLKSSKDAAEGTAKNRVIPSGASGTEVSEENNEYSTLKTGEGKAHNNLPPYITCYMWRRIA